jgi:hypothetical protein
MFCTSNPRSGDRFGREILIQTLPSFRRAPLPLLGTQGRPRQLLYWFLDAGNDETLGRLSWPASKKRQGTKSREGRGKYGTG